MSLAAKIITTRWVVRLPIPMYRAGLGALLGRRFTMIEHVGRKSGEPRFVVLEVVERPDERTVTVAAGFGPTSQWYRNLRANPECHVSTGRIRRRPAHAELLDADGSAEVLAGYAERYPKAWDALSKMMRDATGEDDPEIPIVRLHLAER
ncbi:nitroreductase family deazaflavin-dependent oxidoreductase [Agromyces rhizosphaerae]|uniref:nitroreductase family deazaflavin-dependent oxidoreductase n=1 Tax=Agromyces rhizosphaerae TaxID=88374 RepID=UPI0024927D4A|nr:nitroreductase family deazaflavin-dependent oxidoreductase [Agromyces rhizosphaerae]